MIIHDWIETTEMRFTNCELEIVHVIWKPKLRSYNTRKQVEKQKVSTWVQAAMDPEEIQKKGSNFKCEDRIRVNGNGLYL